MMNIEVPYKPQEYQVSYHNSSTRFKNILGGTRSGKSYPTANEYFKRIMQDAAVHIGRTDFLHYWQISPTYSLNKVAHRILLEGTGRTKRVIPECMVKKDRFDGRKEVFLQHNGIEILIEFKSTERAEKLVAVGINGVWIDETARCKPEAWLGGVRERLSDYMGWALFSTSPIGKNWYYDEIYRRGDPFDELHDSQYANWTFKTIQNSYIEKSEIEAARRQLPAKYFRREYEASLEAFFGQVYEEWQRSLHIYPNNRIPEISLDKFQTIIVGVDWGFRPNPGAFVLIGEIGDKYFQFEEIADTNVYVASEDRHADTWVKRGREIRDRFPDKEVLFFCDPSEPQYINAFLEAGLDVHAAFNEVEPGIQLVAELLHPYGGTDLPRYFVHKSCRQTIREMESYKRDDNGKIVKANDHTMDAVRYALATYLKEYKGVELIRQL